MTSMVSETSCLTLHIGAHKTATTHLQHLFQNHAAELRAQGILVPALDDIRPTLQRFFRYRHWQKYLWSDEQCAKNLSNQLADLDRRNEAADPAATPINHILISDEDFIGQPSAYSRPYPHLERALAIAKAFCRLHQIAHLRIAFCLRDYDSFLPSMMAQLARSGRLPPRIVSRSLNHFSVNQKGWPDILARIEKAAPDAQLILWNYHSHRQDWQQIADALITTQPTQNSPMKSWQAVEIPHYTARLSNDAVAALLNGKKAKRADRYAHSIRIAQAYPISPSNPPFNPYSTSEIDQLRTASHRDNLLIKESFAKAYLAL